MPKKVLFPARLGLLNQLCSVSAAIFLLWELLQPSAALSAALRAEPNAVPGEYLIKFSKHAPARLQASARDGLGVELIKEARLSKTQLVRLKGNRELDAEYGKALLATGFVKYIEPNYILSIDATPNDSRIGELWGLHNTGQTGGSSNADIDAPEAWSLTTGSSATVIGIVDTGINYTHPDLAANMWVNPGEISGNGIDDDSNGVVDDVYGFNAVSGTGNPKDDHSHGSHCAGTIGGVGNNGTGVAGVNWNVKLMALKFLNSAGSGTTQDAIEAIEYAVLMKQRGVNLRVLSNSWGGGGYSQALYDAIAAANSVGILFVAAAGNSASNNDSLPSYPANYDIPNVISVAAVDHDGNLATFSNYGATTVDLAAPGVNILSTVLGSSYASYSGTSMATPHVSGVAGLVVGREPNLTVPELKTRLLNTVKPFTTLNGVVAKPGLVNAFGAMTNSLTPTPPTDPALTYSKASIPLSYDSQLGTRVLNQDDGYTTVDLGFTFPYYRKNTSQLVISANGRVIPLQAGETGPAEADYSNRLNAGINPFHDDLFPSPFQSDGGVWFKSDGSTATVTWVAVGYALRQSTNAAVEIRFQLTLNASGAIQFHYFDVSSGDPTYDYGASASVGLIPPTGAAGSSLVVSNNAPDPSQIASGKALQFELGGSAARSDFDGDGKSDIVVWRPSTGFWFILSSSSNYNFDEHEYYQLGLPGDVPRTGDFDGDRRADMAVWRPGNGTWYFRLSTQSYTEISSVQWGLTGDVPLAGDLDGDLKSDLAIYRARDAKFYALLSGSGYNRNLALAGSPSALQLVSLGGIGYDPLLGDFTGDGKDDFVAVWQPARFWTVKDQSGATVMSAPWGYAGDTPLTCDWEGDGLSDRVVVRVAPNGALDWYAVTAPGLAYVQSFGSMGDAPECNRDYDGDGQADMRVYRQANGHWFIRESRTGTLKDFSFGLPGDIAL